ncbi:MAG: class I SAM-dependent methyltransferase [Bacteroidales bacterium]|jgi:SAM-dependent methyltransferase|nr:class I SAM-dependent methyltransferase [Bacteroidales bacterium]
MQDRHKNRDKYFQEQGIVTEKYVIPFINSEITVTRDLVILEIGCGEAGNLRPFLDLGCKVIGIDIAANKIENARKFYANHPLKEKLTLIAEDIYNINPGQIEKADLIIMRDTLEHIPDQEKFLSCLNFFLKQEGKIFLGFPPWRMPFGGHQQMCESRLNKIPYFHLLPERLYVWILKKSGETQSKINGLLEVRETRISISRFKRILQSDDYKIDKQDYYLINPNYEIKFRLRARKLPWVINIPYLRDFFITTCYFIISKR